MRNLKKLLAVVVTLVMVVTLSIPAFAADTAAAQKESDVCQSLGMILGSGNGVTPEYLATQPTRLQGAIMFLRLKGLEGAAKAFLGTDNFADVAGLNADNTAILAYLKANPTLGYEGVGDNKFDPNGLMTAKQYYKVLLVALGYKYGTDATADFGWNNVFSFAASKGIGKLIDNETFTVNDLAIGTVEALKVNPKGATTNLLATLVAAGTVASDKAVATGLYTVPVVALVVDSVSADNLKVFTVKFNKEVNSDTVIADNFTIAGVKAGAVSLGDDKKTVTVTIADAQVAAAQPANYDIVVNNVKDLAGVAMAKYTKTLRVLDTAIPTITKVALTGPNTFDVTFSEPIKTAGTVKVNNGIYGIATQTISSNVVTVTLAASSLTEATYNLEFSGYLDYAGFSIDKTTNTLAYAKDASAITATIKSATQTEVVVTFNKAVTLDASYNAGVDKYEDYFYQTFSTWMPDTVASSGGTATDKEWTLTFTKYPIPTGTTNLTIKYKASAGVEAKDAWGNKLAANIVLPVTVTADTTAPTVTKVETVDEKTIDVFFSETMNEAKAEDESNFTVKDADGKAVTTGFTNTYDSDDKKVTMVFNSKLTGGNYTVTLKGQEDIALSPNALAEITMPFTITDKTPIDPVANAGDVVINAVESAAADTADILYVTYGEKMAITGQYSVLSASNYLFDGAALPDGTTLELFGSTGKVVKISIPDGSKQVVIGKDLTIGRVADLAGNAMTQLSYAEAIGTEGAPVVTAVKQIDSNKVEITVDKPLTVVLASGFTAGTGVAKHEMAAIETWKVDDSNHTVITAILNAANASDAADTSAKIANFDVVANINVAETGVKMAAQDAKGLVTDNRAPKLIATNPIVEGTTDKTIEIKFTEALDATVEGLMAQDLVITDKDGNVLTPGLKYTTALKGVGADAAIIVVTGTTGNEFTAQTYKVKSKDSITYIRDAAAAHTGAAAFKDSVDVVVN